MTRENAPFKRIEDARRILAELGTDGATASMEALGVLTGPRESKEVYDINLGMTELKSVGKLNLMNGTLDDKELARNDTGAFDRTLTRGRGSPESRQDFREEAKKSNQERGFIFAKDAKGQLFAIPHTWDNNDPSGSVGVFKGDRITYTDANKKDSRQLDVIGTFDSSRRGLQLAAAAAGDALGRDQGIKQTAVVLGSYSGEGSDLTNRSLGVGIPRTYIPKETVGVLNRGDEVTARYGVGVSKRKQEG